MSETSPGASSRNSRGVLLHRASTIAIRPTSRDILSLVLHSIDPPHVMISCPTATSRPVLSFRRISSGDLHVSSDRIGVWLYALNRQGPSGGARKTLYRIEFAMGSDLYGPPDSTAHSIPASLCRSWAVLPLSLSLSPPISPEHLLVGADIPP